MGANRFQFDVAERMIDIFMFEGWKIVVRFVVGIFKHFKGMQIIYFIMCIPERVIKLTTSELVPFINDICDKMDVTTFLKVAFCIKLTTKTIKALAETYEKTMLSAKEKELIDKHKKNRQKLLQKRSDSFKSSTSAMLKPDFEFGEQLFAKADGEVSKASIN